MTSSGDDGPPVSEPPAGRGSRRRASSGRRWRTRGLAALVLVVLVGAIWIVVTAWRARADLEALRHDVSRLRADLVAGQVANVQRDLSAAQVKAAAAHARTTGPAWWVGAHIPGLRAALGTIRAIALTGHTLSRDALPQVVAGGVALDPKQLRTGPDRIDLARLQQAGPPLARALPAVVAARQNIAAQPGSWLGPVANGRRALLRQLTSLEGTLHDTVLATRLMPTMLGGGAPRTYLVVFEGDNEARAIGGILGGYGILSAHDGHMQFRTFGSDRDFHGVTAQVNLGRQFEAAYGGTDPYRAVQDADVSPHFPNAAKIWSSMAEQRLGTPIDGVIALDPVALARVLAVIGPVRTPDGTTLTGKNLVRTLDVDVYRRFDSGSRAVDTPARKAFFVSAAKAVTQAVLHRAINSTKLLHALARSAGERRLLVYSANHQEETQLATTPLAGILPRTTRPFAQLVVTDDSGTKLSYFLDRSLTYERSTCGPTVSTVTVELHNNASSAGLPAYMTRGVQWGDAPHPPGSELLTVSFYATQGSTLANVTRDGQPYGRYTAIDRGHPITETSVTLPPGGSTQMVFTVNEPAATGPVVLPVQPLARPMAVRVDAPSC
ncbi:MAG TPA: DUF4012 domain-containing protein [Mycobacteriales bacterium]|nr:DUF4012 domain-containing protein [Mycobacteriales bacterium]